MGVPLAATRRPPAPGAPARPTASAPGTGSGSSSGIEPERFRRHVQQVSGKLGLKVEWNAAPAFAMIRHGACTIGLLAFAEARKEGVEASTAAQKSALHVEFTTDDLHGLYEELKAKGVRFHQPPHDEPWERSMTAFDPDGYAVVFAQGKRGKNQT